MVVYLFLIACAKVKAPVRIAITSGMCAFFLYHTLWDIFLFLCGLVLADLNYIHTEKSEAAKKSSLSPRNGTTRSFSLTGLHSLRQWAPLFRRITTEKALHNVYWVLHFLLATYILSMQGRDNYPVGQGDPGYVFLW